MGTAFSEVAATGEPHHLERQLKIIAQALGEPSH